MIEKPVQDADSGPKISFQNVTRRFGEGEASFLALDRLNLDVGDGEFVTVVGPSGCGKSTAMNIAAGLTDVSDGRVLVDGKPVDGPGPERGVIFQQYALFPWLTVRQNVEFGLRIKRMPAAERRRIADHFISLVGLKDFADALPKTLSGGMDDTVIGEGTKIDNLVQIGHNVRIGRYCGIVSQVGIAGSAQIGDGVMIGGGVGVNGHTSIGSGAQIAAMSGVASDVPAGERYGGIPARPMRDFLRDVAEMALRSSERQKKKGGKDE